MLTAAFSFVATLLTLYRDGALLAPMDGIISTVEFDDSTGTTTYITASGATGVMTLYPDIAMTVTIGVDETDILALKENQEAEITVSSVGEEVYPGLVSNISKTADTSTGVTQYSAEVTLDREAGMLAGMTASVDVRIQGTENALIIPVDALHQNSAAYYVYTAYDTENHRYDGRTEVTIGMQNDDYVEITSGLNEGDTVYYTESQSFTIMDMFAMAGSGGMSGMSGAASRMPSGMGGGAPGGPGGGMPGGMGGNQGG